MTFISNFHQFHKYDYSMQCVVPENIQTPTTEGISNRFPPDFSFAQGNMSASSNKTQMICHLLCVCIH